MAFEKGLRRNRCVQAARSAHAYIGVAGIGIHAPIDTTTRIGLSPALELAVAHGYDADA